MQSSRALAVVVTLLALATSCAAQPAPRQDSAERTAAPSALPEPTGEVVLVAHGNVGQPNTGDEVRVDIAGLESLGVVTELLYEPFISADVEFTGVPLNSVLAAMGVESDADLTWTALDDYQVHFSRGDIAGENALLATRQWGQPIPIEDGGPIRVVFADDSGLMGRDTNQWIWSLADLEVG